MVRLRLHILLLFFMYNTAWSQVQTVGLFFNTPESFQGYTLFSNNTHTYLIDNCGYKVNEWESQHLPGSSVYLLENGHLLRTARISGNFSGGGLGGRFEIFDWSNALIWSAELANVEVHSHHDIAPLPNGNFLALCWQAIVESEAEELGWAYEGEVWSEMILELEPAGHGNYHIVWKWRLVDHIIQDHDPSKANYGVIAGHPELININFNGLDKPDTRDWFHLNAIDYNESLDQIVVSSRNFGEIWIIDHSTSIAEAAGHEGGSAGKGGDILYRFGNPHAYGRGLASDQRFFEPHSVSWISNDRLMVFNNKATDDRSRVEHWTLPVDHDHSYILMENEPYGPETMDWTYTSPGFYSDIMSSAQMLPNSNILICEGREGRFFEVTEDHRIIWEYVNPVNSNGHPILQGGTPRFNQTFHVQRYGPEFPGFAQVSLVPSEPVELAPWEYSCEIYDSASSLKDPESEYLHLMENPVSNKLTVYNPSLNRNVAIWDVNGILLKRFKLKIGDNVLDIQDLSPGIFFLRYQDTDSNGLITFYKI